MDSMSSSAFDPAMFDVEALQDPSCFDIFLHFQNEDDEDASLPLEQVAQTPSSATESNPGEYDENASLPLDQVAQTPSSVTESNADEYGADQHSTSHTTGDSTDAAEDYASDQALYEFEVREVEVESDWNRYNELQEILYNLMQTSEATWTDYTKLFTPSDALSQARSDYLETCRRRYTQKVFRMYLDSAQSQSEQLSPIDPSPIDPSPIDPWTFAHRAQPGFPPCCTCGRNYEDTFERHIEDELPCQNCHATGHKDGCGLCPKCSSPQHSRDPHAFQPF